jgi:hypothetical protein
MPPKSNAPSRNPTSTPTPGANKKPRAPAARWSNEEITSMVSQLVQAKIDGETSENGFKKIASSLQDPLKKKSSGV